CCVCLLLLFFFMLVRALLSTLFPYTTLFRSIPENFKYDVRVRERMLKRGLLTESELTKHVDALADVADQVIEVELKQPALVKESDRKSTRLNSSHSQISYAVFCLKKKSKHIP